MRRGFKTKKNVPWKGWSTIEPKGKQRTTMYKKCGKKCFLGTIKKHGRSSDRQHPDFPICAKGTCKVSSKGLWAAYIRAKQWGKPYSSYKSKGKMVKYGTKKTYYKGSKPTRKRKVYSNVARKAKYMLKKRGFKVGN